MLSATQISTQVDKFDNALFKSGCLLGKHIYDRYLLDRYGVDSCNEKVSKNKLQNIHNLHKLFVYYNIDRNPPGFDDYSTNPTRLKVDKNKPVDPTCCEISKLIEKVNRL